ncbi:MAG: glycerol-3-phosphate 1-O-acyltransferase PlsY [Planctomycetota bacterium]|jgi:glycerol-3-phosphate acyltransferase PlsY
MPNEVYYTAAGLATYFVAAIPFGFLAAKWARGVDLRETGSGNIGATNAARALGGKWFLPILALDFMKGFAPVFWLGPVVWELWKCSYCYYGPAMMAVFLGVMAIGGHMWSVYLSFKGGKGVATGAGVIFALNWMAGLIAVGVWLLVFLVGRTVSLASIVAAAAVAVAHVLTADRTVYGDRVLPVTVFCIGLAVLVIARHRGNIGRLIRGEEKRFHFRKTHESL